MWPKQNAAAMNAFYGDPDPNHDGVPDRAWEDANLVSLAPPYPMVLAWDVTKPVKAIRCHRLVAPSLGRVLAGVLDHYGTPEAIKAVRMDRYGGSYNFRLMRGSHALSIHSWGAAIDLDPEVNAFHRRYDATKGMMPPAVVSLFQAEGWTWLGHASTPDSMHMQAADL